MAKRQPYETLGKNIARQRAQLGLTQDRTSERIGISLKFFQALESGNKAPSFDTLSSVRRAFGCSWDDLLKGC
jgi:transcriptional regulator with XRE-family HTH domain